MFEYDDSVELVVGSSNITRFALLKNFEWNVSLISKENLNSYNDALIEFNLMWENTLKLDSYLIEKYRLQLDYAIEKWDMDYINITDSSINPNSMQRKALRELRRYRDTGVKKALIISATGSGKTYLAAFDARNFGAKRLLYIVHRESILRDAKESFMKVFGAERTYGFYTGNESSQEADFIFATSNMLTRHLEEFDENQMKKIWLSQFFKYKKYKESGSKEYEYNLTTLMSKYLKSDEITLEFLISNDIDFFTSDNPIFRVENKGNMVIYFPISNKKCLKINPIKRRRTNTYEYKTVTSEEIKQINTLVVNNCKKDFICKEENFDNYCNIR